MDAAAARGDNGAIRVAQIRAVAGARPLRCLDAARADHNTWKDGRTLWEDQGAGVTLLSGVARGGGRHLFVWLIILTKGFKKCAVSATGRDRKTNSLKK
jgi:hypothetical protein